AERPQDADEVIDVVGSEARVAENCRVEGRRRLLRQSAAFGGEFDQGGPSVGWVRGTGYQAGLFQTVDGVGYRGGMRLQERTRLVHGECAAAGETQQREEFVACKRQSERFEDRLDA